MRAFKLASVFVSLASALPNPAAKSYAEKMNTFMQETVNFEIEDEHSRVGAVSVHFLNVLLRYGKAVGGSIGYLQKGCDLEDENYQYFETNADSRIVFGHIIAENISTNQELSFNPAANLDGRV